MDMTLIQGTIAGLKAAADIAKGIAELKSITDVQGKVIELQSAILHAQSSALSANADQGAMVDEIKQLKAELERSKHWDIEKQRYQLYGLPNGGVVQALRHDRAQLGEPAHYLCTHCVEQGRKCF